MENKRTIETWQRQLLRRVPAIGILAASAVLVAGCGEKPLTADSTCRDFLSHPGDERADAAVRISSEIEGVPNPGNTMWALSLDGACGGDPARTLREAFGGGADRTFSGESTGTEDIKTSTSTTKPEEGPLSREQLVNLAVMANTHYENTAILEGYTQDNVLYLMLDQGPGIPSQDISSIGESCEAIRDEVGVDSVSRFWVTKDGVNITDTMC